MNEPAPAPAPRPRTRPTPRVALLVLLTLLVYGAGANVGAGTVLLLAAGMAVGTGWSAGRFLRRVGTLTLLLDPTVVTVEGPSVLTATVTVPRGVIGVVGFVPRLRPARATRLLASLAADTTRAEVPDDDQVRAEPGDRQPTWAALPRAGTTAQVGLPVVLGRGHDQRLVVRVEASDAFGLVRRTWTVTGPVVDVTPATGAAAAFAADTVEGAEDDWIAHALAANGAPGTELRGWRPGEAVRAVHWPASERADQLLLRPRGPETTQRRTLTVEDRAWTRDALDVRCRDLVATAERLAHAGVEVELAAGGQLLPWGPAARLLLAELTPNATDGDG